MYNNILIIKPGAIGDTLQLTPVIRALKKAYPVARVSVLVGSAGMTALFAHNPHVYETIVYEQARERRTILPLFHLWRRLRKSGYDLVLNFQRSNIKTWFLASASFPCRVLVYHKARKRVIHAVVNYLETIAPLGIADATLELELIPGPEDGAIADTLLAPVKQANGPLIAFNPGASHAVNRWGVDQFAALNDMLVEKYSAKIILIGGIEDIALAENIASLARYKPVILTGKITLLQSGAVLKQCKLLVTGDTGPLHIATAMGTSVVALFGAADPSRTGPLGAGHRVIQAKGVPCVPCRSRACNNAIPLECMKRISPKDVFDEIASMLDKH